MKKHRKSMGSMGWGVFIVSLLCVEVMAAGFRVVPSPKDLVFTEGEFLVDEAASLRMNADVQKMFCEEMTCFDQAVRIDPYEGTGFRFLWGEVDEAALNQSLMDLSVHPEGYVLVVTPSGTGIASQDLRGLYSGIQTLLQLVEQSPDKIPCCVVADWPDFNFRGFHTTLREPVHYGVSSMRELISDYEWMIRRLARYKYTHLNLLIDGKMELESCPDLEMGLWTANDIRHLVGFAKDRGVSVFPEVKTLGKFFRNVPAASLGNYSDLLEPTIYIGQLDYQAQYNASISNQVVLIKQQILDAENKGESLISGDFKVRNPAVLDFLFPILDEVYEVFEHPSIFNMGCDESYYAAIEEAAEDRGTFVAEYINKVADHLQTKGCTVMMWDDMLVSHEQFPWFFEAHGGPPLDTWAAVDLLDQDIVMASWHYGYTVNGHYPESYPMVAWLAGKGFPVVGVPWFKSDGIVNMALDVSAADGEGGMGTSWSIHLAVREARGLIESEETIELIRTRRELGVFAENAEAFWSPQIAAAALAGYDPVAWEKRWLPGAEEAIAGWDNSFAIGDGVPQSADHVAADISASAFWFGQNPARSDRGSGDLTFGTFSGAAASTDKVTGAQVIYETTSIHFTVVNNGTHSFDLSSFHVDAWRAYAATAPAIQLSILAGGGVSDGVAGVSETLPVMNGAPVIGSDYTDIDLSLAGLADHVLAAGESVVFRLETTSGAIYVDNFALTGSRVVPPEEDSGYADWADGWGVDIGSKTNDYDLDGISNLYEYGLGGDPTSVLSTGIKPSFVATGSGLFNYIYPKRSDNESLVYTVQITTDLIDGLWLDADFKVEGTNITGSTLNFVTNSISASENQKFVRLIIE